MRHLSCTACKKSKKQLPDRNYEQLLYKLNITPQLNENSAAKRIIKPANRPGLVTGRPMAPSERLKNPEYKTMSNLVKTVKPKSQH